MIETYCCSSVPPVIGKQIFDPDIVLTKITRKKQRIPVIEFIVQLSINIIKIKGIFFFFLITKSFQ